MRRRRTALILSLSAILLLGIAVGAAALAGWGPFAEDVSTPGASATEAAPTDTPESPAPAESPEPTPPAPSSSAEPSKAPGTDETDPEPPAGTDSATVVITYADWEASTSSVEVGAYAALVDPAGSCTLTLTRDATTRVQTIDALADVSTMSCGGFQVGRADLTPGTWSAVVTYASSGSSGTSAPVEVVVP